MAEEPKPVAPAPAPTVPAPAPEPAAAPAPTPAAEPAAPAAAVVPAAAPAPEPVKAAEQPAKPAEAAPAPEAAKTVIGEAMDKAKAPEAAKPAEPEKKPDGAKAPEGEKKQEGQTAEPAPLPVYEAFKLPEGFEADKERLGEFTKALGEFETGAKDHASTHAFGQKLLEFHVGELERNLTRQQEAFATAWAKQKTDWKDAFLKDPEIGGNRAMTTVDAALSFIRTHGGTEKQQQEFRQLMEDSGLGNHPAMIRMLANATRNMSEGRPLAAKPSPIQDKKSRTEKMYGKAGS